MMCLHTPPPLCHRVAAGGGNDGARGGPAMRLGDQMNADTEESCTTYNVLKVP